MSEPLQAQASRGVSPAALLVAGAFFMEFLDGTVIATALPDMAKTFGVEAVDLNIGISAYLITLAVLIPASGWIADRFGARTIFSLALAIFTVSSVFCGLATSAHSFVAMRILQGVGGALMVPVGRLAVLRTTPKHLLITAIATLTWPALIAPIIGPPLGGFITKVADWRWIFFINVPLGIIAILLALRIIPNIRDDERRPFDLPGFVATSLDGEPGVCHGAAGSGKNAGRINRRAAGYWRRDLLLRPAPFPPQPVTDDPHGCAAGAHVPGNHVRRIAVPRLHQRRAVPAAAAVPGRFRYGPVPLWSVGAGGVRR